MAALEQQSISFRETLIKALGPDGARDLKLCVNKLSDNFNRGVTNSEPVLSAPTIDFLNAEVDALIKLDDNEEESEFWMIPLALAFRGLCATLITVECQPWEGPGEKLELAVLVNLLQTITENINVGTTH